MKRTQMLILTKLYFITELFFFAENFKTKLFLPYRFWTLLIQIIIKQLSICQYLYVEFTIFYKAIRNLQLFIHAITSQYRDISVCLRVWKVAMNKRYILNLIYMLFFLFRSKTSENNSQHQIQIQNLICHQIRIFPPHSQISLILQIQIPCFLPEIGQGWIIEDHQN